MNLRNMRATSPPSPEIQPSPYNFKFIPTFLYRYLESCVEKPLYVIFRNLCQCRKDEDAFSVLISLLCEMYIVQPKLGYHLLFFLAVK